jgi:hypothetical protein
MCATVIWSNSHVAPTTLRTLTRFQFDIIGETIRSEVACGGTVSAKNWQLDSRRCFAQVGKSPRRCASFAFFVLDWRRVRVLVLAGHGRRVSFSLLPVVDNLAVTSIQARWPIAQGHPWVSHLDFDIVRIVCRKYER